MPEQIKSYTIADLPAGNVDGPSLQKEINANAVITFHCSNARKKGALLDLHFQDVLTSAMEGALQGAGWAGPGNPLGGILAAHTAEPEVSPQVVSLDGPKTSDGKGIFTTARFRGDVNPQYPGAGDDVAGGVRGMGPGFHIDQQLNGESSLDAQFIDSVYVASGHAYTYNGASTDEVTFDLVFPATPVVVNAGNTGNCNLSDAGGKLPAAILIIPAAGDGTHDVDLSAALNANLAAKPRGAPALVTKACPVPAFDEAGELNGFFDWDPDTGVINASATPGSAAWQLYSAELTEVRWVPRMQIADPGKNGRTLNIEVDSKAKKVLPHWIFRVTLKTTDDQRVVHIDWFLRIARKVMV